MNAPVDLPVPLAIEPEQACDVAIIGSGFAGLGMGIRLKQSGVDDFLIFEKADSLDELYPECDFITLHVAKTPETTGMIDAARLARTKPGVRIVNVARGGLIDEAALAAAIVSGQVAGAAIDVFAAEPTTESPLFGLPQVVVTPHLGASTREAQDKAGETIAEMVGLALDNDFVPYAVNVSAGEVSEATKPFLGLAERLGALFVALAEGVPEVLEIGDRKSTRLNSSH